jgi:hypothetical protein
MAITWYHGVIDECNLPPNSTAIIDACYSIASIFIDLNDNESTLLTYRQARELLLQHYSPTHSLLAQVQRQISLLESILSKTKVLELLTNQN